MRSCAACCISLSRPCCTIASVLVHASVYHMVVIYLFLTSPVAHFLDIFHSFNFFFYHRHLLCCSCWWWRWRRCNQLYIDGFHFSTPDVGVKIHEGYITIRYWIANESQSLGKGNSRLKITLKGLEVFTHNSSQRYKMSEAPTPDELAAQAEKAARATVPSLFKLFPSIAVSVQRYGKPLPHRYLAQSRTLRGCRRAIQHLFRA